MAERKEKQGKRNGERNGKEMEKGMAKEGGTMRRK